MIGYLIFMAGVLVGASGAAWVFASVAKKTRL